MVNIGNWSVGEGRPDNALHRNLDGFSFFLFLICFSSMCLIKLMCKKLGDHLVGRGRSCKKGD